MTSLSEQFSAVRQSQWETQLDMFRQLSNRALDNTEQLLALNIRASRASMEQASGTVKQLLEVSNPSDLAAVSMAAQGQWHQLFAYGRELLGITTGLRGTWSTLPPAMPFVPAPSLLPSPLNLIPASGADVPASPSQAAEQVAIAAADAATVIGEISAAAADIGSAMAESALDADAALAPASEAAAPAAAEAAAEAPADIAAPAVAAAESAPEPVAEFAAEPAPEPAAEPADQSAAEPAAELSAEPAAAAIEPVSPADAALAFADAASDTAIADDAPPLDATPLVKALSEVAPKPASVEHPIVSTVPLEAAAGAIELPPVAPIEYSAPPVQPAKPSRAARRK